MPHLHHHVPDDDTYVREEGVLVPRNGGHDLGCDEDEDRCAPDDLVEDPVNDEHVPGTVDDLPYDYGVAAPIAADQQFRTIDHGPVSGFGDPGSTGYDEGPPYADESPLGSVDERELWQHQRPLIAESADEPRRYRGLSDAEARVVDAASGEDAGELNPEGPEGTSATGSAGE